MKIYEKNIIDQATLLPSSAAVGQDTNRLKDAQLASTFNFGAASANIVIDLVTTETIEHFIVDIGQLTGLGTYTLEGNISNSWDTPAYSQALNITDTMLYLDLSESYRYWRLSVVDTVNVEFGYISIGGTPVKMPGIDPGVTLSYNTTSSRTINNSGQTFGDDGYEYLETSFSFPQVSENGSYWFDGTPIAGRKELLEMWNRVKNINPVWVMLWEKNLDEYAPVFCVLNQSNMSFKKLSYGKYYSTGISLRQVL